MFNLSNYQFSNHPSTSNAAELADSLVQHQATQQRWSNRLVSFFSGGSSSTNPAESANETLTAYQRTNPNEFRALCRTITTNAQAILSTPASQRTEEQERNLKKCEVLKELPVIKEALEPLPSLIPLATAEAAGSRRRAVHAAGSSSRAPNDVNTQADEILDRIQQINFPSERIFALGKELHNYNPNHPPAQLIEVIANKLKTTSSEEPVSQPITKELLSLAHRWEKSLQFACDNVLAAREQGKNRDQLCDLILGYLSQALAQHPEMQRIGSQAAMEEQFFALLRETASKPANHPNLILMREITELKDNLDLHREAVIGSQSIRSLPPYMFTNRGIGALQDDRFTITINDPNTSFLVQTDQNRHQVDTARAEAKTRTKETITQTLQNHGVRRIERFSSEDAARAASAIKTIVDPSTIQFFSADGNIPDDRSLLGRGAVSFPISMDYGADWQRLPVGQQPFHLISAAALNIGETANADDFEEYSYTDRSGIKRLDEEKYLSGMERIYETMLSAQEFNGINHTVVFPFGMGAFLRNLGRNDSNYSDPRSVENLRYKIAQRLIQKLHQYPNMTVHLCLPVNFLPGKEGEEMNLNYKAFITALYNMEDEDGQFKSRLQLHINADATAIAQQLANHRNKVGLWNASNKHMIGHFWYSEGANFAIEENIIRRSAQAGLIAALLNGGMPRQVGRERNYIPNSREDNIGTRIALLRP